MRSSTPATTYTSGYLIPTSVTNTQPANNIAKTGVGIKLMSNSIAAAGADDPLCSHCFLIPTHI